MNQSSDELGQREADQRNVARLLTLFLRAMERVGLGSLAHQSAMYDLSHFRISSEFLTGLLNRLDASEHEKILSALSADGNGKTGAFQFLGSRDMPTPTPDNQENTP